jgi:glycosyltransferase involved in cell wall biosynthesis
MEVTKEGGECPLYSVITVVLNDRIGFLKTANSLQLQDCPDYEWVIVDGGSKYGTVEEIKEYIDDKHLAWWCSEPDKGIYDAMNKGLRHASGKYLVYMSADDLFFDAWALGDVAAELLQAAK